MNRAVMIVAGGTGGHVYPGLAVADRLRESGMDLYWLGTRAGIEARIVPQHGFKLFTIPATGLRRSGVLRRLSAPFSVSLALLCAIRVMLCIRPRVVLGMGGFVSGPGGVAAWLCRRPLVIHEQNAVAGLTNRWLSHLARRVLEAVPGTFAATVGAISTGNPVRRAIVELPQPAVRQAGRTQRRVLVFGGSRGARALNELVPKALAATPATDLSIVHQCGDADVAATRARYAALGLTATVEVTAYIDDMASAYAAADLVIARAGALTIAEIAACGVASVLIPYPFAVDDHQSANARYLVEHGAAVMLAEATLTSATLGAVLGTLLDDRERLAAMANRARSLARNDATQVVARHCLELADA